MGSQDVSCSPQRLRLQHNVMRTRSGKRGFAQAQDPTSTSHRRDTGCPAAPLSAEILLRLEHSPNWMALPSSHLPEGPETSVGFINPLVRKKQSSSNCMEPPPPWAPASEMSCRRSCLRAGGRSCCQASPHPPLTPLDPECKLE